MSDLEILKQECSFWEDCAHATALKRDDALAERSRLREALEKIATHHHPLTRGCAFDARFARAALKEEG